MDELINKDLLLANYLTHKEGVRIERFSGNIHKLPYSVFEGGVSKYLSANIGKEQGTKQRAFINSVTHSGKLHFERIFKEHSMNYPTHFKGRMVREGTHFGMFYQGTLIKK